MKILLVAPGSDFSTQIYQALCRENHEVTVIDDRQDYSIPSVFRDWRWLWQWSRRISWWRRRANAALQQRILNKARTFQPQLFLAVKGMNIRPATLHAFAEWGIPTACWFMDNATHEPYASWVHTIGPEWKYLFSFDPGIASQFPPGARTKVAGIAVGINPDAYRPTPISDEDRSRFTCQICFVGAPYPDRVELLSQVTDLDLKVFGWPGWKHTALAKYYHGVLDAQEATMAYRLAQICVNTNVLPHANGVNLKTFEICAAGGFQLTDECPDLSSLFVIGNELDTFHDSEEFRRKVEYWLAHDEERRHIALAGQSRALRDHSIQERVRQLLGMIQEVK